MKNKEYLLKIYSSYLPYELQFIYSRDIPSEVNTWKLVGLIDRKDSDSDFFAKAIRSDYKNQINVTLSLMKPILYSMDNLTKEIEHKGEKFYPYEKLHLCFSDVINLLNEDLWIGQWWDYEKVCKLIEWHFNVFNLPDELIVRVSEDFNPYK